jgi:hypothetical protein
MIKEVKQEEFFNLARSRKWNQHEIHENPFLNHRSAVDTYDTLCQEHKMLM